MSEKKENLGIKLDFDTPVRDVTGKPVYESDEFGREDKDKPMTMRSIIANLLWNLKEDEDKGSINNAVLALKIYNAKAPITLKDEERTEIKKLIRKRSGAGMRHQILEWMEGNDIFAE